MSGSEESIGITFGNYKLASKIGIAKQDHCAVRNVLVTDRLAVKFVFRFVKEEAFPFSEMFNYETEFGVVSIECGM